jgi:hypothetical protein
LIVDVHVGVQLAEFVEPFRVERIRKVAPAPLIDIAAVAVADESGVDPARDPLSPPHAPAVIEHTTIAVKNFRNAIRRNVRARDDTSVSRP